MDLKFVLGVFGGAEQFRSLHAAEHDGERCLDVAGLPRRGTGDEEARIMAESLLGGGASAVLVGILRQGRDCEGVETSLGRLRPSRFVPDSYRQTHREKVIHCLYAFELRIYRRGLKGGFWSLCRMGITWLTQTGIAVRVPRISKPGVPQRSHADLSAFKLFLPDVGLLGAMAELGKEAVIGGSAIFEEFKGALTKQHVCQQLIAECATTAVHKSICADVQVDL